MQMVSGKIQILRNCPVGNATGVIGKSNRARNQCL